MLLFASVFDETMVEADSGLRLTDDFREYPYQAYDVRRRGPAERRAFCDRIIQQLHAEDGRYASARRIFEAEAFHLILFSLSGEVDPDLLWRVVREPVARVGELGLHYPAVRRYSSLLRRTTSMIASKRDRYDAAYKGIIDAHQAIAQAPDDAHLSKEEAAQQIWLQECGQLVRLLETNMIESDIAARRRALAHGEPPVNEQDADLLTTMARLARYGVYAGYQACRLLEAIESSRDALPHRPDGGDRMLAAAGWRLTARIMYMRAVLVQATIDLARKQGDDRWRDDGAWRVIVARVFEECLTADAPIEEPRLLDLNRVALHYSFLAGGAHPLARTSIFPDASRIARAPHLFDTSHTTLDRYACSQALAEAKQDANILDNFGFSTFYRLFDDRGGEGARGYTAWLKQHRDLHTAQLNRRIDDDVLDQIIVRSSRQSTRGALRTVTAMAARAPHYHGAAAVRRHP